MRAGLGGWPAFHLSEVLNVKLHLFRLLITLACAASAMPSAANWHVAESRHFVVYVDGEKDDVERFATLLERYASAISVASGIDLPVPSPSARLTVFVVDDRADMRKLLNGGSRLVTGFYLPRATGSVAFVPSIDLSARKYPVPLIVLLHEYAHHYMALGNRSTAPLWLREGFAEYLASARFLKDGSVEFGHPASHRWRELLFMEKAPLREMLGDDSRDPASQASYDGYYGKAWLLYHYLATSPERAGQLDAYRSAIASGTSPSEAARAIFGEFANLERALLNHYRNWETVAVKVYAKDLSTGPVIVTELGDAEATILPVEMQLKKGVSGEVAQGAAVTAAKIAERYPDSAVVLADLAHALFDAGDDAGSIDAANRALALDPTNKDALLYKGYALFRQAPTAADSDRAYGEAMNVFAALNALENDHPVPLVQLYRSFVERGLEPTEQAKQALARAAELAPHDRYLQLAAAAMHARDGRIAEAQRLLSAIAFDPHGEDAASQARDMLGQLGMAAQH